MTQSQLENKIELIGEDAEIFYNSFNRNFWTIDKHLIVESIGGSRSTASYDINGIEVMIVILSEESAHNQYRTLNLESEWDPSAKYIELKINSDNKEEIIRTKQYLRELGLMLSAEEENDRRKL
jgi:hypothetical protein